MIKSFFLFGLVATCAFTISINHKFAFDPATNRGTNYVGPAPHTTTTGTAAQTAPLTRLEQSIRDREANAAERQRAFEQRMKNGEKPLSYTPPAWVFNAPTQTSAIEPGFHVCQYVANARIPYTNGRKWEYSRAFRITCSKAGQPNLVDKVSDCYDQRYCTLCMKDYSTCAGRVQIFDKN